MDYERDRNRRSKQHDLDSEEDEGFVSARRPRDRDVGGYEKRKSRDYDGDRRKSHPYDGDRRKSRNYPEYRRRSNEDEEDRRRSMDEDDEEMDEFDGRKPRVSMSAESPVLTRSRPETYDSQYRKLKQLVLPGNPDRY